jgi:predicted O-methyltransferase YrrM
VFDWVTDESDGQNIPHKLEMIPRERAAVLSGIQNCAAQPTGLIMFDMRAFDLTDPVHQHKALIERGFSRAEARLVARPWFYYEFKNCYEAEKCSTEDVTATRDMSLAGIEKLGYNPIYCNWNAWAGHHKPKCVRKPRVIFADQIGDKYRMAVKDNLNSKLRRQTVDFPLPEEKPKPVFVREELDPIQKLLQNGHGDPRLGTNGSVHTENGDPRANRSARKDNVSRYPPMFTPSGDLFAVEQLAKAVGSRCAGPLFIEVGSWVGETALALSRGCPRAQIHCVDNWMGSPSDVTSAMAVRYGRKEVIQTFLKNTHGTSIRALVGDSKLAAAEWKEPADLVFIDAEHTYEALKSDIEAWWPHLKDGGVMAFHDYHDAQFPGVTRAIDERFGQFNVTHEYPSTVAWVVKNAETTRAGEGGAAQAGEGVQGHPLGREGDAEPSGTGAVLRGAVQGEGWSREGCADVVGSVR